MDAQARAGIDLYGSGMRYAEVEQIDGRYRLLRLGSCDFEFDVAHEVFENREPAHLETVSEAIGDVFSGSVASEVRVVTHPPEGLAFFTPVAAGTPAPAAETQLRREAALLTEGGRFGGVHLTSDVACEATLPDGETVTWHQVLAMPRVIHTRFEQVLRVLPAHAFRLMTSMHGVANTLNRLVSKGLAPPEDAPYTLSLGWYPTHVECLLTRMGQWRFSQHFDPGAPADAAYFTLALLDHLGLTPSEVGRVFFYGVELKVGAFELFENLFESMPVKLNAIPVVDLDPSSLSSEFDVEAYAPCIGVTL
jgi:hypothetical protein